MIHFGALPNWQMHISTFLFFAWLFITPILSLAQDREQQQPDHRLMHHETIDDAYLPAPAGKKLTSPAFRYEGGDIFTTQVNINSDGQNIIGDAANEPSITVDPVNPLRMAIGWRQFDNISSNFRQAGYGYTLDGGQTWTFPGVINPGVFRSDPVLDCDADGIFYYNSLTVVGDDYFCDVYKTEPGGVEWDNGTYAQGGDKQWMNIDRTGGIGNGHIYAYWNTQFSVCYPGGFTRSVDGGSSYEECVEIEEYPYWGTQAIGPEGELYLVGGSNLGNGIVVIRSTTARESLSGVTWDQVSTVYLDGHLSGWNAVNPQGLLGQAWIDVDKSNGPGHGNIYVVASLTRNSIEDPADVMFAKSTDGGLSWEDPVRINTDFSVDNYQWFGTMSVAPDGRIDVVWLDTRDAPQSSPLFSSLYYSYSIDQGETWSDNQSMSDLFDPHVGWPDQNKMGDYFDMISDNEGAHLAWANTLNGGQDVYYSFIPARTVGVKDPEGKTPIVALITYPNPFKDQATIKYQLTERTSVKLAVYDVFGQEVQALVNTRQDAGIHEVNYTPGDLAQGVYYCRLQAGNAVKTTRLFHMK